MFYVAKLQKLSDMTKPRLVKVRALLYVFQHVIKKRLAYFDTASVGNGLHLCGHFFDLRMGQGLNAEVVIFLKLVLHEVVAAVNLCDNFKR